MTIGLYLVIFCHILIRSLCLIQSIILIQFKECTQWHIHYPICRTVTMLWSPI